MTASKHFSQEFIFPLLRCPGCGSTLRVAATENRIFCNREHGPCPVENGFPMIDGRPALVMFDRSVLDEASLITSAAGSPVRRRKSAGPLRAVVRKLLAALRGGNRSAAAHCQTFLEEIRKLSPRPVALNVGGATAGAGTQPLRDDPSVQLACFDVYASPATDFVADAHDIPLPDASVDGVWIQAVLEHVIDPPRVVAEIHRVLKPGGIVYAEIPFMQTVHEGAYDFTRYTDNGVRWLFRWFDRMESGAVLGPGQSLLWSIGAAFGGLLRNRGAGAALAAVLFFWVRFIDLVIPKPFAMDAACGLYFFGRKASEPIAPKDVIRGYQGVS